MFRYQGISQFAPVDADSMWPVPLYTPDYPGISVAKDFVSDVGKYLDLLTNVKPKLKVDAGAISRQLQSFGAA